MARVKRSVNAKKRHYRTPSRPPATVASNSRMYRKARSRSLTPSSPTATAKAQEGRLPSSGSNASTLLPAPRA